MVIGPLATPKQVSAKIPQRELLGNRGKHGRAEIGFPLRNLWYIHISLLFSLIIFLNELVSMFLARKVSDNAAHVQLVYCPASSLSGEQYLPSLLLYYHFN